MKEAYEELMDDLGRDVHIKVFSPFQRSANKHRAHLLAEAMREGDLVEVKAMGRSVFMQPWDVLALFGGCD